MSTYITTHRITERKVPIDRSITEYVQLGAECLYRDETLLFQSGAVVECRPTTPFDECEFYKIDDFALVRKWLADQTFRHWNVEIKARLNRIIDLMESDPNVIMMLG